MTLLTNINAYWKLDGSSGDSTGNGNTGTDTNITYSSANGKINQGAGFDGASSKIALTTSSSLTPTGNFTLNAWIKTSSATNQMVMQSWNNAASVFSGWQFYYFQTGAGMTFQSAKNTGQTLGTDWQLVTGTATITDGNWHMVTALYDGVKLYIYVDNVLDNSVAWTTNPAYAATTYQRIGCGDDNGSEGTFMNGAIDEVGLWGRALSTGEISSLYNAGSGFQYPFGLISTASFFSFFRP
jgi:hypothetical protein